ncbi:hypothetical protein F5144DRAFT_545173 [Chaetomium tenue]|uniref:Uncharacterized protein n=1 Tax=Chaetomium tenue TaxID=1854479 RepID=A0ACB7PHK1_9PEZI|nr:hypothetical protein F5144DRAFT_545173 [Chaetomium globosum]
MAASSCHESASVPDTAASAASELLDLFSYRFVKLSKVREWSKFKRCQDLERDEYKLQLELKDIAADESHFYFISHRWNTPEHPDPDGAQLSRIKGLGDEEALLFYDYCALPQRPRDETQQWLFSRMVKELSDFVGKMKVIVLNDPKYMTRSWCLMEYFMAAFRGCLVCDEVRDEHLLELQATANALAAFREPKSATAAFEAARSQKMGRIAHWFFGIFQDSEVTNGTLDFMAMNHTWVGSDAL